MTDNLNNTLKFDNLFKHNYSTQFLNNNKYIDKYLKQKKNLNYTNEFRFHPQQLSTYAPPFFMPLTTILPPDKAIQKLINLFFPTTTKETIIAKEMIKQKEKTTPILNKIMIKMNTKEAIKKFNKTTIDNATIIIQTKKNVFNNIATTAQNIIKKINLKTKISKIEVSTISKIISENENEFNQNLFYKKDERRKKINLQENLNKKKFRLKKLSTIPLNYTNNLIIELKSNKKNHLNVLNNKNSFDDSNFNSRSFFLNSSKHNKNFSKMVKK